MRKVLPKMNEDYGEKIIVNNKEYSLDFNGYLINFNDWDRDFAIAIAKQEMVQDLSELDWEIIDFIRKYYDTYYRTYPLVNKLVKKFGANAVKKELFPLGPWKPGYKIAGLPGPLE